MLEIFLDFDNTVTRGDVLDRVIERYSPTDSWRDWEAEWQAGRMSTVECLRRQVGALRATREELERFAATVEVDPGFALLAEWSAHRGVKLSILSDNFVPLIRVILQREGLGAIPVFANELSFEGTRPQPRFPWYDRGCGRCAHCKAIRVGASTARPRVFVGDGLSDVCGANAADIVFAKDSLAADLRRRRVPFHAWTTLADVLVFLRAREREFVSHPSSASL